MEADIAKKSRMVIHHSNLPVSLRWIQFIWMLAITVKVWDLDSGWYYAIGTLALALLVGTIVQLSEEVQVDIFKPVGGGEK